MSVITVDPAAKWVSLNLVMASTLRLSYVSIDFHEMWVYEIDGYYIGKLGLLCLLDAIIMFLQSPAKFRSSRYTPDSAKPS